LILSDHIEFIFQDVNEFPFPDNNFRKWIFNIIVNEKKEPGFLNYIFCSDDYLLKVNQEYLNHDTLTDIITFDYSEDFGNISGDIFISIDRIKENSILYNVDFLIELARILGHGVLHICGYKDKTRTQKAIMRSKENHYLDLIDFL
jgi:probable rRNA maturation factor